MRLINYDLKISFNEIFSCGPSSAAARAASSPGRITFLSKLYRKNSYDKRWNRHDKEWFAQCSPFSKTNLLESKYPPDVPKVSHY